MPREQISNIADFLRAMLPRGRRARLSPEAGQPAEEIHRTNEDVYVRVLLENGQEGFVRLATLQTRMTTSEQALYTQNSEEGKTYRAVIDRQREEILYGLTEPFEFQTTEERNMWLRYRSNERGLVVLEQPNVTASFLPTIVNSLKGDLFGHSVYGRYIDEAFRYPSSDPLMNGRFSSDLARRSLVITPVGQPPKIN